MQRLQQCSPYLQVSCLRELLKFVQPAEDYVPKVMCAQVDAHVLISIFPVSAWYPALCCSMNATCQFHWSGWWCGVLATNNVHQSAQKDVS